MAFRYDDEMIRDVWLEYDRAFPAELVRQDDELTESDQGKDNYMKLAWEDKTRARWKKNAELRKRGWFYDNNTGEFRKRTDQDIREED